MSNDGTVTHMMHFQCYSCPMSATMVRTELALGAWQDHMETHEDPEAYGVWTWDVVPLPF